MGCGKRIQSFQRFMSIASAHREVSPRMSTAEPPLALLQGSVAKLAWAIRSVDHYLAAHSEAVARLAEQIARQLGLSDSRVEGVRLAGLFHDVGKIGISEAVLFKPSSLTTEEFETMKNHTLLGAKFLESFEMNTTDWIRMMVRNHGEEFEVSSYQYAVEAISATVRHHHERFDGSGYPDHLKGENTPLAARIVAVAESFDNMISDLPYRRGRSVEEAVAELRRCSGTQFDPDVVEAFVRSLELPATASAD